jgi:hypothetical protein
LKEVKEGKNAFSAHVQYKHSVQQALRIQHCVLFPLDTLHGHTSRRELQSGTEEQRQSPPFKQQQLSTALRFTLH